MTEQNTMTLVRAFAEIIERQVTRFENQGAEYERKLAEHQAAFAARTSADEKIIEWLRIKVQDARAERDALREEVAALQERLRASIARGDFAQMEVAALKSQNPKQHPVKVGEWVRRTKLPGDQSPVGIVKQVTSIRCDGDSYGFADGDFWSVDNCEPCDPPQTAPVPKRAHPVAVGGYLRRLTGFNTTPAGEVARVTLVDDDDPSQLEYEVVRPNGQKGRWSAKGCEPCDSPEATAKLAPKVGDTVRLVTHPDRAKVAEHLQLALQWPWIDRWGVVGQTGKVVKPLVAVAGAVAVALADSTVFARWPIDCLEVVAEATHDTEAGKAAAEAAVKTEPDEIKVGALVEVYQATGNCTYVEDVGARGVVTTIVPSDKTCRLRPVEGYKAAQYDWVSLCDVRKVTT